MNSTLLYYDSNAKEYSDSTVNAEFSAVQERFLAFIPAKGVILDFGCGSGRDTKHFLNRGFSVDAVDGSAELCKMASAYTGIPVKQMLFQDLNEAEKYDGIWACASILHVPKPELPDIFRHMVVALKKDGIIYTSFKYGDFEGERNGRYFSYYTKESFREFLNRFPEMQIIDEWVSGDVRPGREEEKWLNLIIQKQTIN